MRRSLPALFVTLGMLALAGSGCPIWIDEHGNGGSAVCIGAYCGCRSHADCDPGEACVDGNCTPTGNCFYTPCADGYVCDTWGTCIPEETVTCTEDADCDVGYCDLASETCVHTGLCTTDDDCAGYGESFVCDDRGICAPDRGPCPDGTCGCANDTECEGVGPGGTDWLCEATVCRDPAALCTYDYQCPAGAVCVNSLCRVDCSAGASCPGGQICDAGVCLDDPDGGGLCTYSSDCAGGLCVNGYCIQACADTSECGTFETCQSTMCLPQVDRVASCTASDCSGGLSCVDGVCRMPCAADVNCTGSDPFLRCWDSFCRTENEIANQCHRQTNCSAGLSCVDGICL
ncbi:MAG: hypothetical protein HY905_23820 [Deltaproteobacteria bacterium]|nr:hypothetical protein [Deltaproteobacteria bacterium]